METIQLTDREKAIVTEMNHDLYTVEFLEHWLNRNDSVSLDAAAALQIMGANGFYEAVKLMAAGSIIEEYSKKKIIGDVIAERNRQDEKWGEQDHRADTWVSIIGEEYGEMCKAVNEFGFNPKEETISDIYTEAIQTMASCMAMLECIERSRV